jgi:hypothetical protein
MPRALSRYHYNALLDVWPNVRALPSFDCPDRLAAGAIASVTEEIEP